MFASLYLVAGSLCAQGAVDIPPPKAATSRIASVTVYKDQALVTREVDVPEGEGTREVVVTPLPMLVEGGSLYAEGSEGLRVLSTRFRTRVIRKEVRELEEARKRLQVEAQRLQQQVSARSKDLQLLDRLEGFTGQALANLTDKGRMDSEAIIALSKYVMQTRGEKAKAEADLREKLKANAEEASFTQEKLNEDPSGTNGMQRDAVLVVQKTRAEAGAVRLSYLVNSAGWTPQYRLRGASDDAPVRLEYLASVTQMTGEDWGGVRVTLSTSRPSLDAAPPELQPLRMAVDGAIRNGPAEGKDDRSRRVAAELDKVVDLSFRDETPLEDVIKVVRERTKGPEFPNGVPIYVDPVALQESEKTMASPVTFNVQQVPLRTSLRLLLKQLDLTYKVQDGLLTVVSLASEDREMDEEGLGGMAGMGGGFGGMGGAGRGMFLNREAASDQAEELRVGTGEAAPAPPEKDTPTVTFSIPGRLDIPSRNDPQLLEVARTELPAEYFAKAVPVLTPRVYRLAKLTNKTDLVLLPGEATAYVGSDFVGRMRLPLVAAGEQFVAGFGVDPQLQVSRRLMRKERTVQGGNQVFTYEFRIGLRNYRSKAVKVQLWDRMPAKEGESVAIQLLKTSSELSKDPLYERTAKMDNLLRWDLDLPAGTVGDKAMYVNYEFKLEYARDMPDPRFVSGGLKEKPIGGGAMGGLGGMMGGGFRSVGRDRGGARP